MRPDELHTIVRENIRTLREGLGLSQSDLARRVGKSPGYICDLERGRRVPNLKTIATIADGLEVAPALLFGRLPTSKTSKTSGTS